MTERKELTRMPMPKGQEPRWRKKYKHKIYYFRGNYLHALKLWREKKNQLDGLLVAMRQEANTHTAQYLDANLQSALRLDTAQHEKYGTEKLFKQASKVKPPASMPKVLTISMAIDEWLENKRAQVASGHIVQGTYSSQENTIEQFRKWGGDLPVASINEKTLTDFYNHLARQLQSKAITAGYAHQILIYVKAFINEQWVERRIDLPRNLRSRNLSVNAAPADIQVLTIDEVKLFYNRASSLLKTCILLSLNCGFNNIDIATLTHTEVDWKNGTITKKRRKTQHIASVPTITWKLWDITLRQLKKHRSKHPTLVLLGRLDRELIQGGGLQRVDVISKMWRYVRIILGIHKQYKLLRKTAVTTLGGHPIHFRYCQHFLCHSPTTTADAHYVRPDQKQFDKAIKWLGTELGFK